MCWTEAFAGKTQVVHVSLTQNGYSKKRLVRVPNQTHYFSLYLPWRSFFSSQCDGPSLFIPLLKCFAQGNAGTMQAALDDHDCQAEPGGNFCCRSLFKVA